MPLLEERGYFWWNDERVKPSDFASENYVPGLLKIDDDGRITLDLDGCLPSPNQRVPRFFSEPRGEASARNIQGNFRDGKYVLLLGAWDQGGQFSTGGISFERYYSPRCLVGDGMFRSENGKPLQFRRLTINLKGFENWLWLNSIETNKTKRGANVSYKSVRDLNYKVDQGVLSLEYDLSGLHFGKYHESKIELSQVVRLHLTPTKRVQIERLEDFYLRIAELLILLSDSNTNLDWPWLHSADGKRQCRLYFLRHITDSKPPARYECLVHFHKIKDEFGEVFSNWIRKRDQFGPGFYLYLGTRRGVKLYIEHRFVNLLWGLEALDRFGKQDGAYPPLVAKVERILDSVPARDRPWLKDRLKHALEPSLKERLVRTLRHLPLPLDAKALERFCDHCAKLRNDISHFGGDRHGEPDYRKFLRQLDEKSDALASMYHVLLLSEIGIKAELFDPDMNRGWPMGTIMRHLRAAGLMKADIK